MRSILSEKNIVVVLFVMVLITFSLAQEDSRKLEKIQQQALSPIHNWMDISPEKLTIAPTTQTTGSSVNVTPITE